MAEYKISVDMAGLLDAVGSAINAQVMPTLNQAVRNLAEATTYRWKDAVSKAKLRDGEKQAYIQSITWSMTGDFAAVVETPYALAEAIENGRPAVDLKRMLQTSKKVRFVTKGKNSGKRYLIIPFRHNIPGQNAINQDMPPHVYAQAKPLLPSTITGKTMQHNGGKGARARMVPRNTYDWGGRLPAGLTPKLKPHHTTDIHANMVRMNTSAGAGKSSAYLTFRIMGEWASNKWIVPAKPGLYIAKGIAAQMQSVAPGVFAEAVKRLK